MKDKIIDYIIVTAQYMVVYALIAVIWCSYEFVAFKELRPDFFHTIVALVLTWYIVNFKHLKDCLNIQDELIQKQRAVLTKQKEAIKKAALLIEKKIQKESEKQHDTN